MAQNDPAERRNPFTEQMIEMLRSPRATLITVAAVGDLLAEHARFNIWVLQRKRRSTSVEMWNQASLLEHCDAACSAAWRQFQATTGDGGQQALVSVLSAAVEQLQASRINDAVAFADPDMPEAVRHADD